MHKRGQVKAEERPPSARDLRRLAERDRRARGRRRVAWALVAAVAVITVSVVGSVWWIEREPDPDPVPAAQPLAGEGASVEVIDLRSIYPWDVDTVLSSVEKTGRLVVAHEDHLSGGVGAEIVATVTEQGAYFLETPPVRVAHMDVFWGPTQLEPYSTITAERITAGIRRALKG